MRSIETKALAVLIVLGWLVGLPVQAQAPPRYKVDPFWPKELPNNWMFGHVNNVVVDKDDHIWVGVHTNTMDHPHPQAKNFTDHSDMGLAQKPPISECCIPVPQVVELDLDGNVIQAWGGRGYAPDWPEAMRGVWLDKEGNVWFGGSHAPDRGVLKYTPDGKKLLLKIGQFAGPAGRSDSGLVQPNNQDTSLLGGVNAVFVDDEANEVYITDGVLNKRVVVYDSNTGEFKRGWGAYGIPLSEIENKRTATRYDPTAPPSKQFRGPGSIKISNDGLVYVSDSGNHRIQIFTKAGKFVKEFIVAPEARSSGTTGGLAFSRDPDQKYMFVIDGTNNVIRILDRKDGSVVGKFGHTGRNAGQFDTATSIALDSHGNLYVTEVKYNNRIQKFVPEK